MNASSPSKAASGAAHTPDASNGSVDTLRHGEHIATVVINRPAKLNALTKPLWQGLGDAVEALQADPQVRCIVLRGAGEKSFSPGNDIVEFETERNNKAQAVAYGAVMHRTLRLLDECPVPLVAQIHGICVGGGLEIAACCDIRICGESSRFGAPINKLGLTMAYAEMTPLVRRVGADIALEMLLEGTIMGAAEAREKRLVSRVVADTQVAAEALATAERIAAGAPLVARWHKQFARRLRDPAPLTAAEKDVCFDAFDTTDFREGYSAFVAKRAPHFKGA